MHVVVSGAGGLVGSCLTAHLASAGHRVSRLVRSEAGESAILWDPATASIDAPLLEGLDAVVHLAGENIAGSRWTAAQKERIRSSRVCGTKLIAETLASLRRPPRVWVNASAIGYYGNRGSEVLDEESPAGTGFLAETCREWEQAVEPAQGVAGLRIVLLRIGVVLGAAGGALAKMLPLFRLRLGGRLGHGRQYMSWIALTELACIIEHLLTDERLAGPVNAVAPNPVTNLEFTRVLGRVLGRPTWLPAPAPMLRLALGEMGQELLLDGARILPVRLQQTGYPFRLGELERALRFELGRSGGGEA